MGKHQPSEVRRAQLFEAALEVCSDKGFHATRIDDIAARAGLSKGAVYHHFGSKQELFTELFAFLVEQYHTEARRRLEDCTSARESLLAVFRQFMDMFRARPGLLKAMVDFYVLGARDEQFREHFLIYYNHLVSSAAAYIRKGIEQGEFDPRHDPDEVAWYLMTGGDGVVFVHTVLDRTVQGLDACLKMTEIFLDGLRPRKEQP